MVCKKEHLLNNLLFLFNKHLICSPFLHLNMFFYLFLQNISSLPKKEHKNHYEKNNHYSFFKFFSRHSILFRI